MFEFDPSAYGEQLAPLLAGDRLSPLGPGQPNRQAYDALSALSASDLAAGGAIRDPQMAESALAGLWLLHHFLDESHNLSQEIHTSTGSYWHGIMHRREPDYSNSKYWFRQTGDHPLLQPLAENATQLLRDTNVPDGPFLPLFGNSGWDPMAMVDLCQAAAAGEAPEQKCRELARLEWELLFDYCYCQATGR